MRATRSAIFAAAILPLSAHLPTKTLPEFAICIFVQLTHVYPPSGTHLFDDCAGGQSGGFCVKHNDLGMPTEMGEDGEAGSCVEGDSLGHAVNNPKADPERTYSQRARRAHHSVSYPRAGARRAVILLRRTLRRARCWKSATGLPAPGSWNRRAVCKSDVLRRRRGQCCRHGRKPPLKGHASRMPTTLSGANFPGPMASTMQRRVLRGVQG